MEIVNVIKHYSRMHLKRGFRIPTDCSGNWTITVEFVDNAGNKDETQFNLKPAYFDFVQGKCQVLVELWKEFCKNYELKQNSVRGIYFENLKN